METYRLRMKVSEHEFDVAGSTEFVQAQLAVFTSLISTVMKLVPPPAPAAAQMPAERAPVASPEQIIMRLDGRWVSLTTRGRSFEDELLLILLGQKSLRNNDAVLGNEITTGLRLSGRVVVRVDTALGKMALAGDVVTRGSGRARRYRLTNQGLEKAQAVARTLAG